MKKVVLKENKIIIKSENNIETLSSYFVRLNSGIANIKNSEINANNFPTKMFNINESLYLNDLESIKSVINYLKSVSNEDINCIDVYSSAIINKEIKEYFISNNINFNKEKEIFNGFDKFIEKYNYSCKDIYKLIKRNLVEYLFNKYKEEFSNVDIEEENRIKSIIECLSFEILYKLNNESTSTYIDIKFIES